MASLPLRHFTLVLCNTFLGHPMGPARLSRQAGSGEPLSKAQNLWPHSALQSLLFPLESNSGNIMPRSTKRPSGPRARVRR